MCADFLTWMGQSLHMVMGTATGKSRVATATAILVDYMGSGTENPSQHTNNKE